MKTSKHMKYFKNTIPFIVAGAALILTGFLIYWYSFEIWMIGTPVMAVGVVLLIFGFSIGVNDAAYSSYFQTKIDTITSGRRMENAPEYTAAEYSFEGNKFAKFDSTQKARSELYVRTDIYFGKKTLTVESFRVNAAEDTIVNEKLEFPLTEATASLENKDIQCRGSTKKSAVMTVGTPDGKSCSFPVSYNDIDIDRLVEKINQAKVKV